MGLHSIQTITDAFTQAADGQHYNAGLAGRMVAIEADR
jgi:hypothetical protein